MLDRVFSYFTGSTSQLPGNLTGHILLGKWFFQDKWLQSLGSNSNLNILPRKLSAEEMLKITNFDQCSKSENMKSKEYQASWIDMDWNFEGDSIEIYEIQENEFCAKNDTFWFSLEKQINWHECKSNCYKFLQGNMPSLNEEKKSSDLTNWFMKNMFTPDNTSEKLVPFPTGCNRFWLPINDLAEDGYPKKFL